MPVAERAKRLKGTTIGIQGVGSIVHAWERYVVAAGGLDVEKDVRIAPMDPPAMYPALLNKSIDGYATSMPFTTMAVVKGDAIMLAASVFDAPELLPFAYALLYTRPEVCQTKRELCQKMARAYAGAAKMIQEKPDEVFDTILSKRFEKMDQAPAQERMGISQKAHAKDIRVHAGAARQLPEGQRAGQAAGPEGSGEELRGHLYRRVPALRQPPAGACASPGSVSPSIPGGPAWEAAMIPRPGRSGRRFHA